MPAVEQLHNLKQDRAMRSTVVFPTAAMLAVLTMGSMANFTIAVIAPAAAPAIGVKATYIGVFTAIVYTFAMISGTLAGAFIFRYGAIRVCQFTMLAAAAGMAAIALSSPPAAILSAVLLGLAYGPFNPASGHVLAGISPPKWRALIFSVKQTGVPVGGALAGAVVPLLVVLLGWQGAALIVGAVALIVMVLVQSLRYTLDADRKPDWPLASASVLAPLKLVLSDRALRKFSIAGFAYSGCQVSVGAFFVVYLAQVLGMSLIQAGLVFAFVQAGGIFGRVFWGMIADRWVSARALLAGLGFAIAASLLMVARFDPDWALAPVMAVGFVLGASSFGWVGVYLSEITRLAPHGKIGEVTGGVQFVYFGGVVIVPPAFGAIVNLTQSYTVSFLIISALALITGFYLLRGT